MRVKKKRLIQGIILLAVLAAGIVFWLRQPEEEPPVTTVERETLEDLAEETGEIMVRERRLVMAHLPGQVGKIQVDSGDQVAAGELLVEIDSGDWRTSIQSLDDELASIRSQYQSAMDRARHSRNQAASALEQVQKQWEEAEDQLERMEILYESGAVSRQDLTAARLETDAAKAALEQAEHTLAAAEDATGPAARGSYEAAIRQLEREKQRLEDQRDSWFVESPVTGTVLARHVEHGAYVQPGQLLLEIGDLDHLFVAADLLAREMRDIEENMRVRVVHRDLGIEPVYGKVEKIHPTAFAKVSELGIEQRRVRVEIKLDQMSPLWRPGYEVDVEIIRDTKPDVLVVPERSVFWTEGKEHVLIWEDGRTVLRPVSTGMAVRNRIEITEGVREGEQVLTEPENW